MKAHNPGKTGYNLQSRIINRCFPRHKTSKTPIWCNVNKTGNLQPSGRLLHQIGEHHYLQAIHTETQVHVI